MSRKRIGFVGLGRMGANMVRRLKDCGYEVAVVYDVRREVSESLANEVGAKVAETLSEVSGGADVIFTVVSDDDAMRSIFLGDDSSLLAGEKVEGKVFVNCATVTPQVHVEVEEAAERVGARSLEACMASSIPQARDGKLYLMLGGKEAVYEEVKPILTDLSASMRPNKLFIQFTDFGMRILNA